MHLPRRLFTFSLTAAAAAALAVPAGAAAQDFCVLNGIAGNITPGKMLVGGVGEYEFAGTGQCRLLGTPAPNAQIRSRGDFRNTICGTEVASSRDIVDQVPIDSSDDVTTIDDPASPGTEVENARYHIDVRAGQGTVEIHAVDYENQPERAESLTPNGHVTVAPGPGESCTDADGVQSFTVSGFIYWLVTSPAS